MRERSERALKKILSVGLPITALAATIFALKRSRKSRGKIMTFSEIYEDNFCEKWAGLKSTNSYKPTN